MKSTQRILFFTTLILLLTACKKDPPIESEPTGPVMPEATNIGANTFGCYINGELFVANERENYWDLPAVSGSFNEGTKRLNIEGVEYSNLASNESETVQMSAFILDVPAEYGFQYNMDGKTIGYVNWYGNNCVYYYQPYPGFDEGKLTITYLNEEKNIISGKFYINLINTNCENGDTLLKITDGRFDFRY